MNKFIALDIETSNTDYASICQVGLAIFNNGKLVDSWESYVDPEDFFDSFKISVHGIDETKVAGAPKIPEMVKILGSILSGQIVVHHTAFERLSFNKAAARFNLPPLDIRWLDSARVVRRVWDQFKCSGYGLSTLARHFNIEISHHDALEHARAAGEILWRAVMDSDNSLDEWVARLESRRFRAYFAQEGYLDGPFYGETIVFTGALSMPRAKVAGLAAQSGFAVSDEVNSKTTILVVGAENLKKLADHEKSSQQRRAEELLLKGQEIRIISEADFLEMIHNY